MSNRFFFWTLGIFFSVAVILTGIRIFVAQDYPLLIDDFVGDSLGDNEVVEGEESEGTVDDVEKEVLPSDGDLIQESIDQHN